MRIEELRKEKEQLEKEFSEKLNALAKKYEVNISDVGARVTHIDSDSINRPIEQIAVIIQVKI